ncbi:MAG: indole-3-glycerol phosphate synthase [Pirellulaceae bacterium]|nr:MAG: indole-3-glycerol phosphate synthase [Pirellulaceae bacterium]
MATSILDTIVARKRREIAERRAACPESVLEAKLQSAPQTRPFEERLAMPGPIKLIAEIKKASPSQGLIRADFQPQTIARCYELHGATAISVLTDEPFFQGRLEYLAEVRQVCRLPLLRKDFILDRYQLLEARLFGADAVLLIAECLDDCQLRSLLAEAEALGLDTLVEIYEAENLQRVLDAGATLVGINNRNLHTFEVRLEHVLELRDRIPEGITIVAESGIRSMADVRRLVEAGIHAMLVGEHFMRAPDIGRAVDELLAGAR